MEGKGAELVFFKEDGLISMVTCIRHKETQPDMFSDYILKYNSFLSQILEKMDVGKTPSMEDDF
jgi:hypothetical protein